MKKVHNFSAGPSILPRSVFEEASESVVNFNQSGLSILEISHRSPEFTDILNEAVQLVEELLELPDGYKPLFLTGGASSQFFMAPMNLLNPQETACYIDTGKWSTKAIREAKHFGRVKIIASSEDEQYTYIPKDYSIPTDATYVHLTSNNTIFGTQMQDFPDTDLPLICDMSSDIFSRPIDASKFGIIYAGAQKNMGPAGTTLVIVREDLLGRVERDIPTMLDYRTHIKKNSAFNTPPVFPIYASMLNLRWLKSQGGVPAMQERNAKKSALIYEAIDKSDLFEGTTREEDRSTMNATFVLKDDRLNDDFLKVCKEANISGIKGHRSVGGFRASMYNALPLESVQILVDVMEQFEQQHS